MSITPFVDFVRNAIIGFFDVLGGLYFTFPFGNSEIRVTFFDMLLAGLFLLILFKGIRLIAGKDTSSGD